MHRWSYPVTHLTSFSHRNAMRFLKRSSIKMVGLWMTWLFLHQGRKGYFSLFINLIYVVIVKYSKIYMCRVIDNNNNVFEMITI